MIRMRVFERPSHPNWPQLADHSAYVTPCMGFLPPQSGALMIKHGMQDIRIPNIMHCVPMRDPLTQSLACKDVTDTSMVECRLRGMVNRGRYFGSRPQVGNQRGDPRGLASSGRHPTDAPLFPKADSFFAGLPNKLGQPR